MKKEIQKRIKKKTRELDQLEIQQISVYDFLGEDWAQKRKID